MFPESAHGLCTFHLKQNLRKYKNPMVLNIFDYAYQLFCTEDFDQQMTELSRIHNDAYTELTDTLCGG